MSDIMNINGRELIELLSLAFGPSGCEDEVRELIMPRAEKVADRAYIDRMGNLIAVMGFGKGEAKKKIMISSHMDEVGFMISEIKEDGMLGYGCIGGIDPSVVAGRKIIVGDEKGQISGIICSKAIHQKSPEEREKAVKHDKLCMDIGAASREEAEKLAKEINGKTITIVAQGGNDGRLYGSVTAKDIAEELKRVTGVEIDKRKLTLKEAIKAYGKYDVEVKILADITAKFVVYVHD